MNRINLPNLELKTFTEQDASDYCQINNLNPDDIIIIYLNNNELTDISGIKLFKNIKDLHIDNNELTDISGIKFLDNLGFLSLNNNKITDISVLQYLNNLKYLFLDNLELDSNQINYINNLKNLKCLSIGKGFKDISILNQLNKNIKII